MSYISFDQVCKDYITGEVVVHAADHVNFSIEKGELCVVEGLSGSGEDDVPESSRRDGPRHIGQNHCG